jgi:hypothetical protein
MAYGSQAYMNRRPGVGWYDESGALQQDVAMQMGARRQQGANEQGRMLGQGYRMAAQQPAFQPPVPPVQMGPPPGGVPQYGSSEAMGGFAPQTGLTFQQVASKVAGPVAALYSAMQGVESGRGYAEAGAQVDEMHPDDQRAARADIRKAATTEAVNRMRSGAMAGSALGPVGTTVGALGGAYGALKGGSSAVGRKAMLSAMAKETGKQQAVALAAGNPTLAAPAAMYAGIKKLKDLF